MTFSVTYLPTVITAVNMCKRCSKTKVRCFWEIVQYVF